ncbi:MAG: LysE family translocator [Candidatus Bipolaricaulia bacterium]
MANRRDEVQRLPERCRIPRRRPIGGDKTMTLSVALAFALAMLVQAAVPGPGVFATVARSLAGGFRPGIGVVCGIVVGDIIYALLAVFALSTVARSLGEFFIIVRILGGAYLVWLGVKLWVREPSLATASAGIRGRSLFDGFAGGLVTTLSNPKAILFYGGFLPAFFDLSRFTMTDTIVLVSIVVAILSTVLTVYALLATVARGLFSSRKGMRRLNRAAGSVMIATGMIVATRS